MTEQFCSNQHCQWRKDVLLGSEALMVLVQLVFSSLTFDKLQVAVLLQYM